MNHPSDFERLVLTQSRALKYMKSRFSIKSLWTELSGTDKAYFGLLGSDMLHFDQFRSEVRDALSMSPEGARQAAVYWASFLKPRIEALEFQSTLRASFAAYSAAALGLLAVAMTAVHQTGSAAGAAALGFVLTMYFSLRRFEIERRRSWYKYMVAHLEAICNEA